MAEIAKASPDSFLRFSSTTGQTAFPTVPVWVRADRIESVQGMSDEMWVWQQQADAQHYAKVLQGDSQARIAEAQEALIDFLRSEEGDA